MLSVVAIRASPSRVSSPEVRNHSAAGVSGSRGNANVTPVTVAGQPRIRTGVPPRCYLSTAWHTGPAPVAPAPPAGDEKGGGRGGGGAAGTLGPARAGGVAWHSQETLS